MRGGTGRIVRSRRHRHFLTNSFRSYSTYPDLEALVASTLSILSLFARSLSCWTSGLRCSGTTMFAVSPSADTRRENGEDEDGRTRTNCTRTESHVTLSDRGSVVEGRYPHPATTPHTLRSARTSSAYLRGNRMNQRLHYK